MKLNERLVTESDPRLTADKMRILVALERGELTEAQADCSWELAHARFRAREAKRKQKAEQSEVSHGS